MLTVTATLAEVVNISGIPTCDPLCQLLFAFDRYPYPSVSLKRPIFPAIVLLVV